jgi:hypothetical protein
MGMATRLKKIMAPMLKEECDKAFRRGFDEGKAAGWEKRILAYENEIECQKKQIDFLILKCKELAEKYADKKN